MTQRLTDIKEQIQEQLANAWAQFQDTSLYTNLSERYESFSPGLQKLIQVAIVLSILLFFSYIPYSYYSASTQYVADFEKFREATRSLLQISGLTQQLNSLPIGIDSGRIRGQVDSIIERQTLQPEQIGSMEEINQDTQDKSQLVKKNLSQAGLKVQLKKLNLTQLKDVLMGLDGIRGVKMTALEVVATPEDPHYFDLTAKLVNFSFPRQEEPPAASSNSTGRGRARSALPRGGG